jgi:transposase
MPELLKDRVENRPHPAKFFLYIANILYLPFYKTSNEGTPPYDRVTLVALILYGFYKSNFSAETILEMAKDDLGAIWILRKMSLPSSKTIDRVIKAIMKNIELIFMQIIKLCEAFDLIGKERAFIDGTKTKANASKHKAMSYGYLCEKIENNNNTIQDLMEEVMEKINLDDFENPDDDKLKEQILDEAQEIYKTAERIHQQELKTNQEAIFSGKNQ